MEVSKPVWPDTMMMPCWLGLVGAKGGDATAVLIVKGDGLGGLPVLGHARMAVLLLGWNG